MRKFMFSVLMVIVLVCSAKLTFAQDKAKADEPVKGFRGEFLAQMADIQKKLVDLAEATPADKYSWRPMEGVRSISEVYIHIAGANYLFPTYANVKKPDDLTKDAEKNITEKAKVIDYMKKSFAFMKDAVMKTPDADLDKPTTLFGGETTIRGVFFEAGLHMHEHFGQSIAYARMNKIVPPWTAAEQAKENTKK